MEGEKKTNRLVLILYPSISKAIPFIKISVLYTLASLEFQINKIKAY